jgi:uncharacterized protein YjiS (DUF1127 family)
MNAPIAKEPIALLISDSLAHPAARVQGSRPSSLSGLIRRAVSAVTTLPRRRAVIDELSRLTDRELADIGLSRGELKRIFDAGFRRS